MPTYKKADETVTDLAAKLLAEHECFAPIIERKVRVDYLFAYPKYDEESGQPIGDAIRHQGKKALGLCRKIGIKDRAKGMGDVEITVDWDWWDVACDEERAALLDHELYHIGVSMKNDDLGRPVIKLRKHDVEVGWFSEVARRHGRHSQEQIQARKIFDQFGQALWPDIVNHISAKPLSRFQTVEVSTR